MDEVYKPSPIDSKILDILSEGGVWTTREICERTRASESGTKQRLSILLEHDKIKKLTRGHYTEKTADGAEASDPKARKNPKSAEILNRLLRIYNKVLINTEQVIDEELLATSTIAERIDLIKSLRYFAATIDQLLKRDNIVNQGYDTNTRQAQEDAKKKTSDREKQELEHLPPEDQLEVVGDYDVEMRALLESLPEPIQKKVSV